MTFVKMRGSNAFFVRFLPSIFHARCCQSILDPSIKEHEGGVGGVCWICSATSTA